MGQLERSVEDRKLPSPLTCSQKGERADGRRYESVGSAEVMNTPQIRGRGLSICAAAAAAATTAFPHSHRLKLFSVFFFFFPPRTIPAALIFFLIFLSPVPPFFIYPLHPHRQTLTPRTPPFPLTSPPPPPPPPSRCRAEGLFWGRFGGVDRLSSGEVAKGKGSICRLVGQES